MLDDGIKHTMQGGGGLDLYFDDLGGSDKDKVKAIKSLEDLIELARGSD